MRSAQKNGSRVGITHKNGKRNTILFVFALTFTDQNLEGDIEREIMG